MNIKLVANIDIDIDSMLSPTTIIFFQYPCLFCVLVDSLKVAILEARRPKL